MHTPLRLAAAVVALVLPGGLVACSPDDRPVDPDPSASTPLDVRNPDPATEYDGWSAVDVCRLLQGAGSRTGLDMVDPQADPDAVTGPGCVADTAGIGTVRASVLVPFRADALRGAGYERVTFDGAAGWQRAPGGGGCEVLLPTSTSRGVVLELDDSDACGTLDQLAGGVVALIGEDPRAVDRTTGPPPACQLLVPVAAPQYADATATYCAIDGGPSLVLTADPSRPSGDELVRRAERTIAGRSVSLREMRPTTRTYAKGRRECVGVWEVPGPGRPSYAKLSGASCRDVAAMARTIVPASLLTGRPPSTTAPFYRDDEAVPGE
ncbi:hypothetical protein [Nocardioides daeguensis]|uniref:Septum formation-related domain-containing protein n=1 Tax=Nocardioides daeguensis TaxID=908359 RepID=A0ABP6V879_9ACTN|nr:hypothetical protein [Nocardioides daeguensis]MBV6726447.1 hypothetical protein [Nocardioides daeguensis]MCR1772290.1 hypothetical protein [Nocardioides daeguensis]